MTRDTLKLRTREVQIERLIAAAARAVRELDGKVDWRAGDAALEQLAEALSALGVDARREQ